MDERSPVSGMGGSLLRSRLHGLSPSNLLREGLRSGPHGKPGSETWAVPSLAALRLLFPDYEIVGNLGQGGMGLVYEARQKTLSRKVALKVLPIELGELEGMAARFRSEAETIARVQHPGIVAIYDFGSTSLGHLYYSMEFVEGEDLATRLERGPLPLADTVRIICALSEALEVLHRNGIVHRDLKPGNILLEPDGHPRLVDFGLASSLRRELASPRLTRRGNALGTLEYAAPEQLAGDRTGPAADLYSLGVVAYELLTGELPRGFFEPPSIRNREVDPAFDGLVMAALQSDPSRRPGTAKEFRRLLVAADERRRNRTGRERLLRAKARHRLILAAGFGILTVIAAGVSWFGLRERRIAVLEAERAERFQTGAESLVTFMIEDLEGRLEELGRLDVLDDSLRRTEQYFEQTRDQVSENDPAALTRHASFYRNRALIHRFRSEHRESIADLQRARALRERALALEPDNPTYRLELGRCLTKLGECHALLQEDDEALAWASRALATLSGEGPGPPTPEMPLLEWVRASHLQASLLARNGRAEEARPILSAALAISQRRSIGGERLRAKWEFARATIEQEFGVLEASEGHPEASLPWLETALATFRSLHEYSEWELSAARSTCEAAGQLGAVLLTTGEVTQAAEALGEAGILLDQMARRSPQAPYVVALQGRIYPMLADVCRRLDRPNEAAAWEEKLAAAERESAQPGP